MALPGAFVCVARLLFARLRIVETDVTTRIDSKGQQCFAVMTAAEKVVSSARLLIGGEIERQDEIGDFYAVYLIPFILHRIAHLEPMEYVAPPIARMRSLDQHV